MSKPKLSAIIIIVLLLSLSFSFSSRALAQLTTLYPEQDDPLNQQLILSPELAGATANPNLELQLQTAEQVVTRRLAKLELTHNYEVERHQDQLQVTLPGKNNTRYLSSVVTHVGEIHFIDGGAAQPPIGQRVRVGQIAQPEANLYRSLFSGEEVVNIVPPETQSGQIFYQIAVDSAAAERFSAFAQAHAGNYVCIVMDQEVISCSAMYYWDEAGLLEILPNLSSGSVVSLADLAIFLDSGPLPLALKVQ